MSFEVVVNPAQIFQVFRSSESLFQDTKFSPQIFSQVKNWHFLFIEYADFFKNNETMSSIVVTTWNHPLLRKEYLNIAFKLSDQGDVFKTMGIYPLTIGMNSIVSQREGFCVFQKEKLTPSQFQRFTKRLKGFTVQPEPFKELQIPVHLSNQPDLCKFLK